MFLTELFRGHDAAIESGGHDDVGFDVVDEDIAKKNAGVFDFGPLRYF